MTIGMILSLVLPIAQKLVGVIIDRVFKSGVSTTQGVAGGAATLAVLSGLGCDIPLAQQALVAGIATLPAALATDAGKTGQSFLAAMQAVIQEAKRPNPGQIDPMNP